MSDADPSADIGSVRTRLRHRIARRFHVDPRLVDTSRRLRSGVHDLGPGLVTGVADDDPSGIATGLLAIPVLAGSVSYATAEL